MKELYNALKELFEKSGFNVAPYAENTFFDEERTAIISLNETNEIEPLFGIYETTFKIAFVNGETWEDNSSKLSDALCSCIPFDERPESMEGLPDNTPILKLLEPPEFSEIEVAIDDDNANVQSGVTVSIFWER